ncbi:SDR family NAD(P)-dependent oxidoreductase [Sandaracinus amylolyticus]|uniref:SDR family NAD(P)-dependent oxidoreductase n=1 Tax=Sandaracinus amylolyticus TaxID=927083 RepID=UPI001F38F790|nr:SDR family oxidoreductase [Sandaracinus amylolyticus]UJR84745.1 Hypothetical protein I5071_68240 [Sandaracinus amylolyticus]
MELELSGKRALVTGSTAGIGRAIAARLAEEGAEVIVHGRTTARVEEAIAAIAPRAKIVRPRGLVADLATAEGVARAIAEVPEVDVLVNNVGAYEAVPLESLERANWERLFAINVISGAELARHHLPRMLARDAGRIVFISSESALQVPSEMIHYGATKAAQSALARGLAELTRGTRVTVNSVLAGPTRSEGVERFVGELAQARGTSEQDVEAEFFRTVRPTSLIQRFLQPEEIADVVAFLASARGAAISGAAVRAEGGLLKGAF